MDGEKLNPNEVEAWLEGPLRRAHKERGQLIPMLGAGLSRPIGSPDWHSLAKAVASAIAQPLPEGTDTTSLLTHACGRLPKAAYRKLIRQQLDTVDNKTTLAHQALVTSGVERIITTNLDFG